MGRAAASPSVLLPNNCGQMIQPNYGEPEFRAEAKARLPELAGAVDAYAGLLHPCVAELAAAGREAIEGGDFDFLQRLFDLIASAVERSDTDTEVMNAAITSFLEPHDFDGPHGGAAWALLPARLRALIHETV